MKTTPLNPARKLARTLFPGIAPALAAPTLAAAGKTFPTAPDKHPLRVIAYINLTSGCQKPTEAVLRRLAAKYPKRLHLEFVDFGGRGRSRWIRDGMHCMGIKIAGSTKVKVMEKGAWILVPFQMPVGYNWTLKELEAAVRQKIEGLSLRDKTPPKPAVAAAEDHALLTLDGRPAIQLPLAEKARLAAAATAIGAAEKKRGGLVREDFTLKSRAGKLTILAGNTPVITVAPADAAREKTTPETLAQKWLHALQAPFPVRTRPLPNGRQPWKLKMRKQRGWQ